MSEYSALLEALVKEDEERIALLERDLLAKARRLDGLVKDIFNDEVEAKLLAVADGIYADIQKLRYNHQLRGEHTARLLQTQ